MDAPHVTPAAGSDARSASSDRSPGAPRNVGAQGWVLAAGLALALVGLARSQGTPVQPPTQQTTVLPSPSGAVTADSNNRMIAVTGIDITGASILYLVDTVNYRLAVYQATGGSESTQGIRLVGARRIDLDLQLHGLNDKSKYTYNDLRKAFAENDLIDDTAPGND
jgi:hypothetical protein